MPNKILKNLNMISWTINNYQDLKSCLKSLSVASLSAIGVNNNFPAGKTAVSHEPANYKLQIFQLDSQNFLYHRPSFQPE